MAAPLPRCILLHDSKHILHAWLTATGQTRICSHRAPLSPLFSPEHWLTHVETHSSLPPNTALPSPLLVSEGGHRQSPHGDALCLWRLPPLWAARPADVSREEDEGCTQQADSPAGTWLDYQLRKVRNLVCRPRSLQRPAGGGWELAKVPGEPGNGLARQVLRVACTAPAPPVPWDARRKPVGRGPGSLSENSSQRRKEKATGCAGGPPCVMFRGHPPGQGGSTGLSLPWTPLPAWPRPPSALPLPRPASLQDTAACRRKQGWYLEKPGGRVSSHPLRGRAPALRHLRLDPSG